MLAFNHSSKTIQNLWGRTAKGIWAPAAANKEIFWERWYLICPKIRFACGLCAAAPAKNHTQNIFWIGS